MMPSVHRLDVVRPESLAVLCAELGHEAIDVLVNNAGVYYEKFLRPGTLDYDTWMQTLEVNTLGPQLPPRHERPLLPLQR